MLAHRAGPIYIEQIVNHGKPATIAFAFVGGACYRPRVTHLAQIIFVKSLILAFIAAYQEARDDGLIERWRKDLLRRFQHEWDRRRAEQPLALTDQRTSSLGSVGTVE